MGLLTRLPVPPPAAADGHGAAAPGRKATGAWAYPVIGAALGTAAAAVSLVATAVGLGPLPSAVAGLGTLILVTGALHEDGLADLADGMGGGWSRERRLEIMRDSHIGAFGAIALALTILMRAALMAELLVAGMLLTAMLATGMLSRAAMVALWAALPPARSDGLSAGIGRPTRATAAVACLASLAGLVLLPPEAGAAAILASGTATAFLGWRARRALGGQTGDVLGAGQQVAEIAALAAFAATLA